jgi:HEAT repeat protein
MPFVKRDLPAPAAAAHSVADSLASHIAALGRADPDARWSAARALGGHADAVSALASALGAEQVPRVRGAIMTALIRVGDEASVQALLPSLRSQDAGQRAAAIEALQSLPDAILPYMASLLADADSDVRILATELARNMSAADANRVLCGLLEHERHPNVCAAAIEVLAEVGTRDAVPALQACAERFADTPFLPFAASTAIARISDAKG